MGDGFTDASVEAVRACAGSWGATGHSRRVATPTPSAEERAGGRGCGAVVPLPNPGGDAEAGQQRATGAARAGISWPAPAAKPGRGRRLADRE